MDNDLLTTTNNPSSLAKTDTQSDGLSALVNAKGGNIIESTDTPITSQSFQEQPDFNLSNANVPATNQQAEDVQVDLATDVQIGQAEKQAKQDALSADVAEAKANTESDYRSSMQDYVNEILNGPTYAEMQQKAYKEGGVDEKQLIVDKYDTQLLNEQTKLRRTIERINKEGGGLKIGAQAEIANAERDSLSKQADIALLRLDARDELDYATRVANRAVDAMYARQEAVLEARKLVYEDNKELFTTAEQREFDLRFADRERRLEEEKEDRKTLQSTKIDALKMAGMNGAPQYIKDAIANAKTPEEIYEVGGQYASTDMLQRAVLGEQLKSMRTKPEIMRQTQVIDQGGRKLLIDTQTGEMIKDFGETDVSANEIQAALALDKISAMEGLRSHKGLNSAVGANFMGRIPVADAFTGAKDDFVGTVYELTSGLSLTTLQEAQASGATFGALSDAEWQIISASASKINKWADAGWFGDEVEGYDIDVDSFLTEVDVLLKYAKVDAIKKGASPEQAGVMVTDDGKLWFEAYNGDLVELPKVSR